MKIFKNLLLLLILWPVLAFGGADIAHSSLGNNSSLTAGPVSTTAVTTAATSSTFVMLVGWYSGPGGVASVTVSDTINGAASGNTYTQIGSTLTGAFGGNLSTEVMYCQNCNGGLNHVAKVAWSGSSAAMIVFAEITGGTTTGILDQISSGFWNDDVASPFTANAITPTQASELVLAFTVTGGMSGTETLTWGNSFVQVQAEGDTSGVTGAVAKLPVSSIASYNSSFTSSGGGTTEAITSLVSFKSASGGGSTAPAGIFVTLP